MTMPRTHRGSTTAFTPIPAVGVPGMEQDEPRGGSSTPTPEKL